MSDQVLAAVISAVATVIGAAFTAFATFQVGRPPKASSATSAVGSATSTPGSTTSNRWSRLAKVGAGISLLLLGVTLALVLQGLAVSFRRDLSVDEIPLFAVTYQGKDYNSEGLAKLSIEQNEANDVDYAVSYSLPITPDVSGYAGLALKFLEAEDLSEYKTIEVLMSFEDNQTVCYFFVHDIATQPGKGPSVRISSTDIPRPGITESTSERGKIISIPINPYFTSINWKAIKEIGFEAYTGSSQGDHSFVVREVRLIKP